jgi:CxxC-x17-CxxC domain-containing protein
LTQSSGSVQRVETKAVCSGCQRETTVPFKPTQGRPVYCRECFQQRRTTAASA